MGAISDKLTMCEKAYFESIEAVPGAPGDDVRGVSRYVVRRGKGSVFMGGERRLISTMQHLVVPDMLERLNVAR